MSTTVSLPDGTSLEFPDGTDPAVIQRAVAQARMHVHAASSSPDFSDVTDGTDELLRKKRQQIADAWKAAAHNAPNEGLGGVPVPDTSPSAVLASTVDLAGATAANANVVAANLPRTVLTGMEEMVNRAAKPFREASGQDQREAAAREWLAQRFSDHPLMPLEATLAGNQLGPQSRVPDPLGPVQEMTQRAQDAATVRLAEASTNLPAPLAATAFWGGTTAGMLADASQYVGGRMGEPFGTGPGALRAAAAREAALSAADMTPEEAAYLARRAEALRSMPGATEAPLRPGAIADAMQPERSILQVGEHADNLSQDVALGMRARPQDAADAAELARESLRTADAVQAAPSRLIPQTPRWATSPEDGLARWPAFAKANAGKAIDPADLPFALEDLPLTRWESTPDAVNPARGATNWSLGDTAMYRFKEPPVNLEARLADRSAEGGHLPRTASLTPQRPLVIVGDGLSPMNDDAERALLKGYHDAVIKVSPQNPFYADVITHPDASLLDRVSPYVQSLARGGPRDASQDFAGSLDRMLPRQEPPSLAEIFGDRPGSPQIPQAPEMTPVERYRSMTPEQRKAILFGSYSKPRIEAPAAVETSAPPAPVEAPPPPLSIERFDPAEFRYGDAPDEYLYHVTSEPNAQKILAEGFQPRRPMFTAGTYPEYSRGKVFFTERPGVGFWQERVDQHLFDQFDEPPPSAVLRVPRNEVADALQADAVGAADAKHPSWMIDSRALRGRVLAPGASPPVLRNLLTGEGLPLDTPYTGTKNAVTTSERIALGLPEVEDLARKSSGDTWQEARTLFEQDPEAPRILAQQVAEKPRVLTPVENDLLLHDRMKMTLDHREALAVESAALDAGDADAAAMAKLRRTSIEAAMDTNDTALKRAGGEWGSAGAARQKLISEDYSPLYLRQRLTVASREAGVPPPPGAVEKLDQLSAQLTDAQQQLAAYESRVSELEAQRNVAAAQRETVRAQRAGVRAATRQQLDQEYEQLGAMLDVRAKAKQGTAFSSGGLDPRSVGIIAKMARNRVQAGVTSLPELVQGIHQTIAPHIPGLEPSEVRDAISGYGVVRNQATRSEAEAALARIRQQGRLVSKIEALQEGEALPAAAARAKPDDVTLALREKLRQTTRDLGLAKTKPEADRLAAIQKRLEQRIADAERGIGNARAPKVKDTPQIKALRQQLQQTLEEHGLAPEGGGRQLTDEQRLAALKTRLTKREAELTDAIATGSIPKKVRRPLALDADAIALQGRVNNLKRQADLIIRKQELAGRGPLEKGLDWTAGWGRFLKLTGTNTLAKISAAAAERALVFKPIEEALGAAWSKVPVVRDVAARAPIEGGGSLDAIAKSYAGFFGKQAREEMGSYLRGGEGNLEAALGKPHLGGEAPAWMSYPGKVHAALKSPAKVAAYEYAVEKQAKFYLGKGNPEALLDPALQAEMKARAWEYAQRDIFMGDNAAVNAFRRAFAHQEGESLAARSGKTAANVLMPIVKVPTNYALEATDYLFGVPKGVGRLAFAVKKGISELPAEQADLIMRQLKKGSLGAAMIGLGAAGVVEGGGYWQAGEHRKESDLQPGEVKVAGITIPHLFLHHPVVEALQVGANLRRAKTVGAGLWTSAKGLAEQVPFIETPVQMGRDIWGRTPMKAVGEFERGMTIPPDAQRLARVLDQKEPRTPGEMAAEQFGLGGLGAGEHRIPEIKAKKRTPRGDLLDQLYGQELLGVPGLRDNVR